MNTNICVDTNICVYNSYITLVIHVLSVCDKKYETLGVLDWR